MSDFKYKGMIDRVNIDAVLAIAGQFINIIEKKDNVIEGYFALKVSKVFMERDLGVTLNTELEIDEVINKMVSGEEGKKITSFDGLDI